MSERPVSPDADASAPAPAPDSPAAPTATAAAQAPALSSPTSIAIPGQFAPRAVEGLEGLLFAAGIAHAPEDRRAQVLASLTELVRLAIDWPTDESGPDARVGDHRSLIVEFKPPDGIVRYVQILSEPGTDLVMEAAPGRRADPALQALADHLAPALAGRGFAIGGSADNFCKSLPVPRPGHAPAIAAELTALLVDVLGWSGEEELTYKLRQDTHLSADWITYGMTQPILEHLLQAWGIACTAPPDLSNTLDARSHGLSFRLQLYVRHKRKPSTYWEIHLFVQLPIARGRVPELLEQLNGRMSILKAWAPDDGGSDATRPVLFATSINLSGGATLAHIKSHIFEWLETVQRLWNASQPPAAPSVEDAPLEVQGHTVH